MNKYNLNQLEILRQYIDIDGFSDFLGIVNPSYSCKQLEVLGKAFKLGIDIRDLVGYYIPYDCLILLCDAKMAGVDVRGLGNEFINLDLLREFLNIKKKNPDLDMSFISDLSLEECEALVADYRLYGLGVFRKYKEKIETSKKMIETEFKYTLENIRTI